MCRIVQAFYTQHLIIVKVREHIPVSLDEIKLSGPAACCTCSQMVFLAMRCDDHSVKKKNWKPFYFRSIFQFFSFFYGVRVRVHTEARRDKNQKYPPEFLNAAGMRKKEEDVENKIRRRWTLFPRDCISKTLPYSKDSIAARRLKVVPLQHAQSELKKWGTELKWQASAFPKSIPSQSYFNRLID